VTASEQQQLGALTAKVDALERESAEQGKMLREVRDAIVSAKGGWWTLLAVGSVAGSIGAFLAKFWPGN
jgi:hypothetical protein